MNKKPRNDTVVFYELFLFIDTAYSAEISSNKTEDK